MFQASVREGTIVSVVVLIICVLGISAAFQIPVQMIPDLETRTIGIETGWPGATPQDIEKEILLEQERYLRSVPNLQRMSSEARTGSAEIALEFPFGVDINQTLIEVTNALSQVPSYPENVDQPRLSTSSFSANSFIYYAVLPLEGNPLGLDIDMMYDFVDDFVRPQLERVNGVSNVEVTGGADRQVQVLIDPAKLAQRGLSLGDVRNAIRGRNTDRSAGDIAGGKRLYLMRTVGRFQDLSELENTILLEQDNAMVRLKDVATVVLDHYELRNAVYISGEQAIRLAVNREAGSNVIDIKKEMWPVVDELNQTLLKDNGLRFVLIGEDVRYVQSSIVNVWKNLAIGALLATMIMYLFLRSWKATLVGVVSIPVCTIAAFFGLLMFDRTINVISLAGIAFAIGMTVDNTIVVLESIEQARRRGMALFDAAVSGVKEVWPAVLASSLTTILVFAPILFIQEEAGQLYSDIAIAISAAILASMLVAITVVPSASARLGFGKNERDSFFNRALQKILTALNWLVESTKRRVMVMAIAVCSTLILAILLMPPAEYLPEGEEPKAFSIMAAPPGYNLSEMIEVGTDLREKLERAVDADPQLFDQGESQLPSLKYAFVWVSTRQVFVMTEPNRGKDIDAMTESITNLMRTYPGMRAFGFRGSIISSNNGGTRAVNLDISGPDLAKIYAAGESAYRRAEEMFEKAQIQTEPSSLSLDQPLIEIKPLWERLAESGLTADEFGYAVAALTDGAFVDEFFHDDDKIDIFLFSDAGQNRQLGNIAELPIMTPNAGFLPLDSLADLVETVDSASVRRIDGRRTVTLRITPPRGVALETAVERVQTELIADMRAAGELPQGVNVTISGAADQLQATQAALKDNFAVALILIYLLLVAIFKHWGYPLVILTTIPLGLAGGLVGLVVLNGLGVSQPFDMITMLGFLILLGTVVNNPILIVDQTRRNLDAIDGDLQIDVVKTAVLEAIKVRLRPIMMSTLTTMFGLAPLVVFPGAGAELYRGVGIVVLAGILCSTIITLTFLPCFLIWVATLRNSLSRLVAA